MRICFLLFGNEREKIRFGFVEGWVFVNDERSVCERRYQVNELLQIKSSCGQKALFFKPPLAHDFWNLITVRFSEALKESVLYIEQMLAFVEGKLDHKSRDNDKNSFTHNKHQDFHDDIALSLKIKSYYENEDQEADYEEFDGIDDFEGKILNGEVDRYGFFSFPQKLPKQKGKITSQLKSIEIRNKFIRRKKRIILEIPQGFCFDQLLNQDNLVWYKEGSNVTKKEINRIEKWRNMATSLRMDGNTEYVFFETKKLAKRVFKGIPDSWRSAAWYAFLSCSAKRNGSKYTDRELRLKYHEYLQLPYAHDFQINLDVPRTISGHVFFQRQYRDGQRLLFRVLHALSLFYSDTGYVQGMASLVATFLCYYDEESAFIMSVRLWEEKGILSIFSNDFNDLFLCFNELEARLSKTRVGKRLFALGINVSSFSTKWYLTLFSHSLSFCTQLRIWDVFLWHHGDKKNKFEILHLTAMAIIFGMKDMLMKADFETAMKLLTSRIHVIDNDALMMLIESEWKSMKKG
ncbi:uncharacterized protein T551_01023 [Pneumocystis jirovecii RU7]|uniref:Rab-GAP TBC domain-containing protein n=1 Tax=Pneumocystis jirovecii (strain RU7) TaxID=1408657 RepID=A0A0W4ZTP3_PNEJ7|nr:uncharacterized protein T551_01023 [Pneumocystis jirovecii RU7]KTW31762.1 hypothetical protein T551_01023 [Pneumocystis jirovecii RU7]